MRHAEAQQHYYVHSGAASTAARQLAFAGIAVVWVLATKVDVVSVSASALRFPLLAFVFTLAFDLLQYYWLAGFWGIFSRAKEKKGDLEFSGAPEWGNRVGIACWIAKGITVAIGHLSLIKLLWPVFLR